MLRGRPYVLLIFILAALPVAAADRFYEELLRDGIRALERDDAKRAGKLLRLACFGLLEEPPELARCLVYLSLSQAHGGRDEDFRRSFDRLLELEQRFEAYSRAELKAEIRRRFEAEAEERLGPESLGRLPPGNVPPAPPEPSDGL